MKLRYRLLSLCMVVLSIFAVGCGDLAQTFDELTCVHDYGETPTHVLRVATCKQEGVEVWTCLKCKKERQLSIDKLPHTEVVDEPITATSISAGKTEGKHCEVCDTVLVAQKDIAAYGLEMELPKTSFSRNGDGTLTVYNRFGFDIPDVETIYEDFDCYGIVAVKREYISKLSDLNEDTIFGERAFFATTNDFADMFVSKTPLVFTREVEKDSLEDSLKYPYLSWSFKAPTSDTENFLEIMTAEIVVITYLKVGDERIFGEYKGTSLSAVTVSYYDSIKKAYNAGQGLDNVYHRDPLKAIAFTTAEKTWLYDTYIKPVDDANKNK